ncbi:MULTISPECIES: 2-dehydropantoate 2-reductase [unclassified Achromobacter]|uniref:2-dehydropantoate 2-reductase n=1 Tax=unclassified Achromobacter TaxID=2626865 RepID=UPI000B51A646|nr:MULTISPECIES: 2-dehydropantoate 2-reductase [unclassified Achromobacter]OWT80801.1 2-dehydropantoate 2-reductase [Achromobacter sp. HZ34]OWT81317.1 2-dehydropantoate 2-reductase [Achromobacter sp. HZ28]
MKILVVGAGAIGGYYGARLIQAGADVTFLVRPKRAAALAERGLRVHSPLGDFSGQVRTITASALQPDYDLVLLSCKTYDLDAALDDIQGAFGERTPTDGSRAAGPRTAAPYILPFLNGLGVYDQLDARYGKDRIIGGASYIATMLDAQGDIRHLANTDVVIVGARSEAGATTAQAFHALITQSPGMRSLATDIEQALWNKWMMLACGALMNCLMRGTIGDILATQDGARLMHQAIAECLSVAQAEGHPLSREEVRKLEERLLDVNSKWAASMMRDISQDAPRLESAAIVGDLITRATRHGIDVPLIRASYCHLQVYARQHH